MQMNQMQDKNLFAFCVFAIPELTVFAYTEKQAIIRTLSTFVAWESLWKGC